MRKLRLGSTILSLQSLILWTCPIVVNAQNLANDFSRHPELRNGIPGEFHHHRALSWYSLLRGAFGETTNTTACVGDDSALRLAVRNAERNTSRPATVITMCARVKIASTKNSKNVTGVDMSKRNIELKCSNTRGARCIIDGQRFSRIFYGKTVTLKATNFDFINAYVSEIGDVLRDGSALSFSDNSSITLNQCSFRNNRNDAIGKGTISSKNSTLTLSGNATSPMIFFNNTAFACPGLYAWGGKVRARSGSIYFNNNTGDFTGAIETYESDIAMRGVTFYGNKGEDNGAMKIYGGKLSLEAITFSRNVAYEYYGALSVWNCDSTIKNVSFVMNHGWHGGALTVSESRIRLQNCTFKDNTNWDSEGADISISDNDYNQKGGSFVACDKTVFCNGVGKNRILDKGKYNNTDCIAKGIVQACKA